MKDKKLFEEFPQTSTQEWEERIKADLKGADYEKKLVWHTNEGFQVKPYYRAEDLEGLEHLANLPGDPPFLRGHKANGNKWRIRQNIAVDSLESGNATALNAIDKGATAIGFVFPEGVLNTVNTSGNLSLLVKDIDLTKIEVSFIAGEHSSTILDLFSDVLNKKGLNADQASGSTDFDPLGQLALTGNFYQSEEKDFNALEDMMGKNKNKPCFRFLTIHGSHFHNAGGSLVQELGFTLSAAATYLNKLTEAGLSIDDVTPHIQINFATGTNYFLEIAKIRATRWLWSKLVDAYHPAKESSKICYIHSETADWNKTIYDPYVNMLRTTTENMSAAIGGVDSFTVKPFDDLFRNTSRFSERIARNTQIVLQEESYFDKITDPAGGSYYIENVTASIAEAAWKIFLETEEKGGFTEAMKNGFILGEITRSANNLEKMIAQRRMTLLGTNQYPNAEEKATDILEKEPTKAPAEAAEKIATPLKPFRGAELFESLRLRTEKSDKTPVVFMLTIGNPVMRKARATFASGFFACAGFQIIDNLGFNSVEEGAAAARKANADIVVVCSADEEYATVAPEAVKILKEDAIVAVAGAPATMEQLKAEGLEHFIHVKTNILESLGNFQDLLNIK